MQAPDGRLLAEERIINDFLARHGTDS